MFECILYTHFTQNTMYRKSSAVRRVVSVPCSPCQILRNDLVNMAALYCIQFSNFFSIFSFHILTILTANLLLIGERVEQSWTLEVFFYFFNNKKSFFGIFYQVNVELYYASVYTCVCVLVYAICVYTPVPNKAVLYWPLAYPYACSWATRL